MSRGLQTTDKIKKMKDSIKRRRANTDQEVVVGVEVDKREKNIVIVNKRKRKSIAQEEIKDLNKKIEIQKIKKKKKRNNPVNLKMRILLKETVNKKEKEISHIVNEVIQAKLYLLVTRDHIKKTLPTIDSYNKKLRVIPTLKHL